MCIQMCRKGSTKQLLDLEIHYIKSRQEEQISISVLQSKPQSRLPFKST